MLMCSLHHSPSDQVQNGRIFVKNIVFERTFSAKNNAIPAIAGVVNMAIIRNVLEQYHGGIRTGKAISLSNISYRSVRK